MFKIAKEFNFEMAHLLDGHDGKCQNLHGHGYTLQVELSGDLQPCGAKKGMVTDYADLQHKVTKLIIEQLDHAFIYDSNSIKESKIAKLLLELNLKVYPLATRTTAEELSRHIYYRLKNETDLPISAIRLSETARSFCEYTE